MATHQMAHGSALGVSFGSVANTLFANQEFVIKLRPVFEVWEKAGDRKAAVEALAKAKRLSVFSGSLTLAMAVVQFTQAWNRMETLKKMSGSVTGIAEAVMKLEDAYNKGMEEVGAKFEYWNELLDALRDSSGPYSAKEKAAAISEIYRTKAEVEGIFHPIDEQVIILLIRVEGKMGEASAQTSGSGYAAIMAAFALGSGGVAAIAAKSALGTALSVAAVAVSAPTMTIEIINYKEARSSLKELTQANERLISMRSWCNKTRAEISKLVTDQPEDALGSLLTKLSERKHRSKL